MGDHEIVIRSARKHPENLKIFVDYIASRWTDEEGYALYEDCISHAVNAEFPLPEWFVAFDGDRPVGCAGLITNDFISRMDLMPWLCALYVEEEYRGKGIAGKLIESCRKYAHDTGFGRMYLATDHTAFYERYGGVYIGEGVHPWREKSRIYRMETKK